MNTHDQDQAKHAVYVSDDLTMNLRLFRWGPNSRVQMSLTLNDPGDSKQIAYCDSDFSDHNLAQLLHDAFAAAGDVLRFGSPTTADPEGEADGAYEFDADGETFGTYETLQDAMDAQKRLRANGYRNFSAPRPHEYEPSPSDVEDPLLRDYRRGLLAWDELTPIQQEQVHQAGLDRTDDYAGDVVILIASGYDWDCEACGHSNHVDAVPENDEVTCAECSRVFEVEDHTHPTERE